MSTRIERQAIYQATVAARRDLLACQSDTQLLQLVDNYHARARFHTKTASLRTARVLLVTTSALMMAYVAATADHLEDPWSVVQRETLRNYDIEVEKLLDAAEKFSGGMLPVH